MYSILFWSLFGSRPTSQFAFHVTLFVCLVTKKGISLRLSLLSSYLLDLFCQKRSKTERILTVLWVLAKCQLYLVTYGFHRKNISTTTGCSSFGTYCRLRTTPQLCCSKRDCASHAFRTLAHCISVACSDDLASVLISAFNVPFCALHGSAAREGTGITIECCSEDDVPTCHCNENDLDSFR